jgi:hypothetical protein
MQPRLILFTCLLFAASLAFSQTTFQKTYHTTADSWARKVLETPDGYLISCLIHTAPQNTDAMLIKIDFSGNVLWQKTYGGLLSDELFSVVIANDGGYIASGFTLSYATSSDKLDTWIIKLDTDGNILWQKVSGTPDYYESLNGPIIPVSGGYIFSGDQALPGYDRSITVRTDNDGNTIWSKRYAVSSYNYQTTHFSNNGKLYGCGIAGYKGSFQTVDLENGDILQSKTYDSANDTIFTTGDTERFDAVFPASDGNLVLGGSVAYDIPGLNSSNPLMAKIAPDGAVVWAKTYSDGIRITYYASFLQAQNGGYLVNTGANYAQNDNASLFKIDEEGNILWARQYGGDYSDAFYSIIATADGGYIAVGYSNNAAGKNEIFVVKMDADGLVDGCCTPGFPIKASDLLLNVATAQFTVVNFMPTQFSPVTNEDTVTVTASPFCGNLKEMVVDTLLFNPGDTVLINGVPYDQPAVVSDTLPAFVSSCDTILVWVLQYTPQWFQDLDGDGFGDENHTINALITPTGYVANSGDCKDTNPLINPNVPEDCSNGIDDNCDGLIDVDTNNPIVVCVESVEIAIGTNGFVFLAAAAIDDGSYDNCGDPLLVLDRNQFFCSDLGPNPVFLIATDDAGNSNFCWTTVTVVDKIKPVVIPPSDTIPVYFSTTGTATLFLPGVATASDNCGTEKWYFALNTPLNFTQGETVVVESPLFLPGDVVTVWVQSDDASGNRSIPAPVYILLKDSFPPTALCNAITVAPDASGNVTVNLSALTQFKSDNTDSCYWLPLVPVLFQCNDVGGMFSFTLQVNDLGGNTATCTAMVTVVDAGDADGDGITNCADMVSSSELYGGALQVYPNPAKDHIIITWPATAHPENVTCTITDMIGRKLLSKIYTAAAAEQLSIALDVSRILTGSYLLQIVAAQQTVVNVKIIIE